VEKDAVADVAAVYVGEDGVSVRTAVGRRGHVAREGQAYLGKGDGDEVGGERTAEEGLHPGSELVRGLEVEQHPAPVGESKPNAGSCQRHVHHLRGDVVHLRGGVFEEFSAHGGVVEEVAHVHSGAGRAALGAGALDLSPVHGDGRALLRLSAAGPDFHTRDRAYAGESLAPEAEGVDLEEVVRRAELARGVAQDRKGEVLLRHALSVVGDRDTVLAAVFDHDLNPAGARVDGVLYEFLHNCARAFDDLAGGNHVHHDLGELVHGHGLVPCNARGTKKAWPRLRIP
jgi:hypothetical protein